jgi:DNA-binding Lrp family transcriptional regulator
LEIGEVDLKIIGLLQEDPRSFSKIADKLDIAVGTVYNHVRKLEDKGVLKGYTVKVDFDRLGYSLTAIVLIQVDGRYRTEVEKELAQLFDVIAIYDITGEYDVLVIARFKDKTMLNSFIKNVQKRSNVKKTIVNVALDVLKEDFRVKL